MTYANPWWNRTHKLKQVEAERDHYKQRVEELEAALELIAGYGSEPYRDPAADLARLALLDQTDE